MRAVFISILLFLLLFAFLPATAGDWLIIPTGGIRVHVHRNEDALTRRIGTMAATDLPRIAHALGVIKPAAFDVYAYSNRAAFFTDTRREPFTLGVSYAPSGDIRLDATANNLRNTLAHELTHSLIAQRLQGDISALPIWANEGIAGQYATPLTRSELRQVAQMIHQDGVLTLDELESAFSTGRERDAAYLQSRSMVAWLDEHYPNAMRTILARMADDGDSFEQALFITTNLTPERWLSAWMNSVPDILFWIMLLNTPVVYAPLAILLVIIMIIRLRKRQIDDSRQQEDNVPADDDEELDDILPD